MGKSRFSNVNHDDWVRKNASTAKAEDMLNRANRNTGENLENDKRICFTCSKANFCSKFKANKSKNVFSFGGDSNLGCNQWEPIPIKKADQNKIKKLMNEFKRLKGGLNENY